MSIMYALRLYGVGVVTCFGLDLIWLGIVAKGFYARHLGYLMRPDIRWIPGVTFYLIYVVALIVFVAVPAIERHSLGRAIGLGAFFGLAAYAAFDLTCLALFRDFPATAAIVDMLWGASLSAATCAAIYLAGR